MRSAIRKKLLLVVIVSAFIMSCISLDIVDRNCRQHVSKLFHEVSRDTAQALETSNKRTYDLRSNMMQSVLTSLSTVAEVANHFPDLSKDYTALNSLRNSLGTVRIDIIDTAKKRIIASTDVSLKGRPAQVDFPAPIFDNNPDFNSFVASMGSYHPVDYVIDRHNRELLLFYNNLKAPHQAIRLAFNAAGFKRTYEVATYELVTSTLPMGETGGLDVVSQNGIIVNSVNRELIGSPFADIYRGLKLESSPAGQGIIAVKRNGLEAYCSIYFSCGYYLVPFMSTTEVYATRQTVLVVMLACYLILFAAVFVSTSHIVKQVMLDGLDRINVSLARIEAGNLEEKVSENSYPEFSVLSQGINSTVEALKQLMESQSLYDAEQLALARTIQLSCLPKYFPTYPELEQMDLCAGTSPAQEVGGDFYDYFRIHGDLYCMLIADVSEHGIPAALLMMTAKTTIHDAVLSGDTLEHCVESINISLCENNSTCMFVTDFVATLNVSTGEFRFVNAGHCRPLLRRNDGLWEEAKVGSGMILGGLDNLSYNAESWFLNPGDKIFLYTDGVTEALNKKGEMFGTGSLKIVLNRPACDNYDPASLINLVHDELDKFSADTAWEDDVTMVALEYHGNHPRAKFLRVPAQANRLDEILHFIDALLNEAKLDNYSINKIKSAVYTAVDDIFTNIVSYAADSEHEAVEVTVRAEIQDYPYQLVLHFIDNGHPYDPTAVAPPDVEKSYEERACGGLGIYLVKKLTDQMTYRYTEGRNILRLVKKLENI